jgi:flagellar protein FliS
MATRLSKAYMLTKVMTATNHEVVVYLYEGIVSYLHRATESLNDGRRGDACTAIDQAINIVIELSGGLNYTTGGHLALRLDGIYNYLIETMSLANSRGDCEALQACEGIVIILHDAWKQAAEACAPIPESLRRETQLSISA